MKTDFKYLQKLFFLLVMGFSLCAVHACRDDDTVVEKEESEDVDFTNYVSTNLRVNGKIFWYQPDWSGAYISDWGDNDRYISFSFDGKTEETDDESIIKISLNESLSMADFVNNNANIATYIFFGTSIGRSAYEYLNGKATIREGNGMIMLNFNNVKFKNSENNDIQALNGHIIYYI